VGSDSELREGERREVLGFYRERRGEGERGAPRRRKWPLMAAITPLRERGRGGGRGRGNDDGFWLGVGSAGCGVGRGLDGAGARDVGARAPAHGDGGGWEAKGRGGPWVGPTCHREKEGRGWAAGWLGP
jgi:hypothetical protein